MAIDLDRALEILEAFLEDPSKTRKVKTAIDMAIASEDVDTLMLVTDALVLLPDADHLEPLKTLAGNPAVDEETRVEAIRSITTILDAADMLLVQEEPESEPILTRAQFNAEIAWLEKVAGDSAHPSYVRRKALENAASLTVTETIAQAGKKALESGDPPWIVTGLYVLRQSDPDHALSVLERYLQDEHLDVRIEAIQGYGELGTKAEYKKLANMIFDSSGDPQYVILAALSEVENERAGKLLEEAQQWLDGEAGLQATAAYRQWVENQPAPEAEESAQEVEKDQEAEKLADEGFWLEEDWEDDGGGD